MSQEREEHVTARLLLQCSGGVCREGTDHGDHSRAQSDRFRNSGDPIPDQGSGDFSTKSRARTCADGNQSASGWSCARVESSTGSEKDSSK